MKCPKCGKEASEGAKFCASCGSKLIEEQPQMVDGSGSAPAGINSSAFTSEGPSAIVSEGPAAADSSYRNKPDFRGKIIRLNIFGAIGFVCSGLGCFASIMLKFGNNLTSDLFLLYLLMLIIGLLAGLLILSIVLIPAGRKLFPDGKAKGFLENLPGVWIGFTVAFIVVALAFQGYMLIIS